MKNAKHRITALLLAMAATILVINCKEKPEAPADDASYADIVIYGGTSAAITAAVEAKRSGKSVIVVSPDKHLGGLTSGGLGWTDTGDKSVIGGLAREFYQRVYDHYNTDEAWKWQPHSEYGNTGQGTPAMDGGENRTMWIFEPHVAESVFESFVKDENIRVDRDEWLDRDNGGVVSNEGKITSISTLSGKTYKGKVFLDATYEGDLMASAGVSYHVGREGRDVYGEEWNGVQTGGVLHHNHWFHADISPYIVPGDPPSSGLLPRVSDEHPLASLRHCSSNLLPLPIFLYFPDTQKQLITIKFLPSIGSQECSKGTYSINTFPLTFTF